MLISISYLAHNIFNGYTSQTSLSDTISSCIKRTWTACRFFEKDFSENLALDDAIVLLLQGLDKGIAIDKQKLDINKLDIVVIEEGKQFERLSKQRLKTLLGKL